MRKTTVLSFAVCLAVEAFAAKVYNWPTLPEGTEIHSEVSTNVAIHVNAERLQEFQLKIEATNTISNEVVVAVGNDNDGDGDLSLDEAAFAFCYDCGERKLVDYRTQEVTEVNADTIAIKRKYFDAGWNIAKVVKRGPGDMGETITETVENLKFEIRLR